MPERAQADDWRPPPPEILAANPVALLDVEEIDTDLYRGARLPEARSRVFGGAGDRPGAASRATLVEGKDVHSLHTYFMRAGNERCPAIRCILRRDGRLIASVAQEGLINCGNLDAG